MLRDPLLRCILRSTAVTDAILSEVIISIGIQVGENRAAVERLASEARAFELGAAAASAASGKDGSTISSMLQNNARNKRKEADAKERGTNHKFPLPS